ncbi:acyl-CoA thioester hydrolase [Nannocystis exedens]|uniref:Acyl-CoA thioester hydrolase n=1 Tax=Nannocystis exedens TaxID=54 RepID=A0A1I2HR54_9BACT|nr:thioesterase family protein [Nannocystis exedens]PCC69423.1 putative thioesterase [Nannocystis exedens]SFF32008.1 acyl-CoA thioester hydrolase [Nannocystis exedens]
MTADARFAEFPVVRRWPVAWGDQDMFAHVNNVVYFRWFESVRIAFFEAIGWTRGGHTGGVGPILASTSCVFKAPLTYPDTVILGARAEDIGDDRFTMRYRVVSERLDRIAAEGEGRIVSFDYDAGVKAPLPAEIRAALLASRP